MSGALRLTIPRPSDPDLKQHLHARHRVLRIGVACSATIWAGIVVAAFFTLERHERTPGDSGPTAATWPRGTALDPNPDGPTVLMLAHPRCPCTRASIEMLGQILAESPNVRTHVIFFTPADADAAWTTGPSWDLAAVVAGAFVSADPDGGEARRFGARTSGHVLAYDSDGTLIFSGGITAARGKAGPNDGAERLAQCLRDRRGPLEPSPVFGCAILSDVCEESGGSP